MLQVGSGADLGEEAFRTDDRRQLRSQHLQRDAPVMLLVMRQVHHGHAARAEFALDSVPAFERRG